jgi:pimeloyl-ACP methyl ester carboxylesterase
MADNAAPAPAPAPSGAPFKPEPTRPVLVKWNDDGSYSAQSFTSSTEFKIRAECLIPSRLVIPIVFLPGIMGTRLRVAGRPDQAAWFPPENTWEKLVTALSHLGRNAAMRQQMLDPDNTEVDDNGPARPAPDAAVLLGDAPGNTDAERAKWRGWGQLHADSYSIILNTLEQRLARILENGSNNQPQWLAAVMNWQDAKKIGAQKTFSPLDEDALKLAASVHYPVHAVGYNWLKSNKDSGEYLAQQIDRILGSYTSRNRVAEKVILVTHSMGGLVARACFQQPGLQDKILGIMHGVMPAIGAPAVYKRMRSGFESMEQVVLGRNAAETTAVMANSPGGLELLPTRQYKSKTPQGRRHWLRASHAARDADRQATEVSTLLGEADPYAEIYLNNTPQAWWRMVKEELIDPAGREKAQREGKKVVEEDSGESDFKKFAKVMTKVQEFHLLIEDKYHPNTYAHYAADAGRPSWNEVHWKCAKPVGGAYVNADLVDDDLNGEVKIRVGEQTHTFEIQDQASPGDGTVPEESGSAPTPHVVQIFRHEGTATGHKSYDHQKSYHADVVQAATLYSIARMVADSDWLKANLCKT